MAAQAAPAVLAAAAVCGFGAMYVATLDVSPAVASPDDLTNWFAQHAFVVAAYLIFFAMVFDALDGRLARMARQAARNILDVLAALCGLTTTLGSA